jgi:hypothetical protein
MLAPNKGIDVPAVRVKIIAACWQTTVVWMTLPLLLHVVLLTFHSAARTECVPKISKNAASFKLTTPLDARLMHLSFQVVNKSVQVTRT